jgi:hypothetical protein
MLRRQVEEGKPGIAEMPRVWVLLYADQMDSGVVSVHRTEEGAQVRLRAVIEADWSTNCPGAAPPTDINEALAQLADVGVYLWIDEHPVMLD